MTTKAPVPNKDTDVRSRRAQYEQFTICVCKNGYVNVRNDSYGDEANDHIYSVQVASGTTIRCSCPSDEHQEGLCKHRRHIEEFQPLALSVASGKSEGLRWTTRVQSELAPSTVSITRVR